MPDNEEIKKDKQAYWAWLDETYGWVGGRGILMRYGGSNPYYQYWKTYIRPTEPEKPLGELTQTEPAEEYLPILETYLEKLWTEGTISDEELVEFLEIGKKRIEASWISGIDVASSVGDFKKYITSEIEAKRVVGVDVSRYTEGLSDYLESIIRREPERTYELNKVLADAIHQAQTKGVTPDLPYYDKVVAGIPYGAEKALYEKDWKFYDWLSKQEGWEGRTPQETATLFAKQPQQNQDQSIQAYEEELAIPPEYKAVLTPYEKSQLEVKKFLAAKKPPAWYEGEPRVPIAGRPETLEAYKEATTGLSYLNGKWVQAGTLGAKTAEELGWYAPVETAGMKVPYSRTGKALINPVTGKTRSEALGITEKTQEAYWEREEEAEKKARVEALSVPYQPTPRYAAGFEAIRPTTGTEPYLDYFSSHYSELLGGFQTILPRYEGRVLPEQVAAETARIEKSWAEYLKKKTPEIKERFYALSPSARGEYPSRYAPPIRTV